MMKCVRCNKALELDDTPHCPLDGISLEASGNWGSSVWDDDRRAWLVLCDECFMDLVNEPKYVQEALGSKYSVESFAPIKMDFAVKS